MKTLIKSVLLFTTLPLTPAIAQQTCLDYIENDVPEARFVVHDNLTITDTLTGLMWAKCTTGRSGNECEIGEDLKMNWQQALQSAEQSDLAGHTNWRVPNVNEYRSIVNYACRSPSINLSVFPNFQSRNNFYWTAEIDTYKDRDDISLLFDFLDGIQNANFRTGNAKLLMVREPNPQE